MTLQLGVLTAIDWPALLPLWQSLGWNETSSSEIEQWYLEPDATAVDNVVLLHTCPETIIARLLERGTSPQQALSIWQHQAEGMLRFFKTHRHISCLVDIQCLQDPDGVEALCQHLGIVTPEALPGSKLVSLPPAEYRLVAHQLLGQTPGLDAMLAQLEACTLPICDQSLEAPEIDLAEALGRLTEDRQEKQLLLEQLHEVQEAFAAQSEAGNELEQQVTEHQRQLVPLHEQLASLVDTKRQQDGELTELQSEHRLLVDQLHLVQEAFAAQSEAGNKLDKQAMEQKSQLAPLNERLASLVEKKQQLDSELGVLQRENQLLIDQLHLVQEAFEQQVVSKQGLEQHQDQLVREHGHALAVANQQIKHLQDELNGIKTSASWKAAAPVRALGKPFRRATLDRRKLKRLARKLRASEYFDAQWYCSTYPDVAEHGMDPAEHYLSFGADESRNPSERFDTEWYMRANPDVAEAGLNPLVHFLNHGLAEGRAPNPQEQGALPPPSKAY